MKKTTHPERRIASECLAGRVRILNRIVTGIYDDGLRPFGVRLSQMSVLVAIANLGPVRAVDVCKRLRLEKSTLSRDLDRLLARSWVQVAETTGRAMLLEATESGFEMIRSATPAWEEAQERVRGMLGAALTKGIFDAVEKLRSVEGNQS